MTDWSLAGQIGGVGFGMVFALLVMLAVIVWLVGLLIGGLSTTNSGDKKGEN